MRHFLTVVEGRGGIEVLVERHESGLRSAVTVDSALYRTCPYCDEPWCNLECDGSTAEFEDASLNLDDPIEDRLEFNTQVETLGKLYEAFVLVGDGPHRRTSDEGLDRFTAAIQRLYSQLEREYEENQAGKNSSGE